MIFPTAATPPCLCLAHRGWSSPCAIQPRVQRGIHLAYPTRVRFTNAPQADSMPPFAGKRALSAEWLVPPLGLPLIVDLPARKRGWEGGNGSGDASSAGVTEAQRGTDTPGNRRSGPF